MFDVAGIGLVKLVLQAKDDNSIAVIGPDNW